MCLKIVDDDLSFCAASDVEDILLGHAAGTFFERRLLCRTKQAARVASKAPRKTAPRASPAALPAERPLGANVGDACGKLLRLGEAPLISLGETL